MHIGREDDDRERGIGATSGSCSVSPGFGDRQDTPLECPRLCAAALPIPAVSYATHPRQLAAEPIAEDMYATPAATSPKLAFKAVSATQLGDFSAGLAVKCQLKTCGGFAGIRSLTIAFVKVSKKGTFKVSGDLFTAEDKKIGTETVTWGVRVREAGEGQVTTHAKIGGYEAVTDSCIAVSELVPGHGQRLRVTSACAFRALGELRSLGGRANLGAYPRRLSGCGPYRGEGTGCPREGT